MALRLFLPLALVTACVAAALGYQWARASVAQDIYRDRLVMLQDEYRALAEQYNQAVTPRPVTELLVEDGRVCVIVRKGEELIRVPTDFDVRKNEVYVDYILADQRLLIRRVFEFHPTRAVPPDKVVYVDKDLLEVDWDPQRVPFGKSLSFSRREDGRYIISVTGDGSLGLKQVAEDEPVALQTRPSVKEFDPIDERARQDVEAIGFGDVWRYLVD